MHQVLGWYRQLDSVIVEKTTVLRVMDYGPDFVTLAVEDLDGKVTGQLYVVTDKWTPSVHDLEVQYDGQYPDRTSPTHTKAGIMFRDIDLVDVRPHSFGGTRVAWRDDWTRYGVYGR